jgi:uncharacterized protein YjiS (DUF1127 family)
MLTTLRIYAPSASFGPLAVRALAALGRGLTRLGRALANRQQAAVLASLDDRMLSDIGLSRSDLRDAYAEPLWRDPTAILASRAAERRSNCRSTPRKNAGVAHVAPSIVPDRGHGRLPAARQGGSPRRD